MQSDSEKKQIKSAISQGVWYHFNTQYVQGQGLHGLQGYRVMTGQRFQVRSHNVSSNDLGHGVDVYFMVKKVTEKHLTPEIYNIEHFATPGIRARHGIVHTTVGSKSTSKHHLRCT